MRSSALLACIFAFATLVAPPSFAATQDAAGFLLDYAQLQPVPGDPGLVRYAAPDVRTRLTKKIYLAPIEIWLSPTSRYRGIDPDEMKALTDELRKVIVSELQGRFQFVEAGDAEAMPLRIALTNVSMEKDPTKLRHFTPVGIAAKAVKTVAGVSSIRLHSAAIEAECFTPDGKERLFAMVDRRTGKGGSGEVRWDQLLDEVRDRARRVKANLDAAAK